MHYFVYGKQIAAVENAAQAAKYAEAGWVRCTRSAFIAAWKARGVKALAELEQPAQAQTPPRMSPGTVLERLPGGMARYQG